MLRVVVKSMLVTLAVIVVGQVISYSGRMATGQPFTPYVFFMNSFLPLVTALPASLIIFWQQHRIQQAHLALKRAHEELAVRAAHDGLTGLLNRETFLARLGAPGALLLIDADNFKAINDTFGHAEGDTALRLIAAALRSGSSPSWIIGRIGGEEFAVFIPNASATEAASAGEKLRSLVANVQFYPIHSMPYPLSVSIGLAVGTEDIDLQHTFRQADVNLYAAKAAGRNTVVASSVKPRLVSHSSVA